MNEWADEYEKWAWLVNVLHWVEEVNKENSKRSYLLDKGERLFPSPKAKAQTEWHPTNSLKPSGSGVIQISKPSKDSK